MRKIFLLFLLFEILISTNIFAKKEPKANITWDKTYGGSNNDKANSIQQTKDGGFIVAGNTYPKWKLVSNVWVFRLDKNGNIIWDRTYGGSEDDVANSIQQTKDGGFIATGFTASKGAGKYDVWVLKLDKNGELVTK